MENSISEFTRSVVSTTSSHYQDQPTDLSLKKQKILVTPDQLNSIKIEAENAMPCTENLALETINPMVDVELPKNSLQHPVLNNSWQRMNSLLLMPHQLESRQQVFNSMNIESALSDDFFEMVLNEASQIINANNVPHEEDSDKENITPETSKTNGQRSSKCPELADNDGVSERVVIGANGTSISRKDWNSINWRLSAAAITRKILMAVFDRHTLAHNTLSGKPSPAFINYQKPEKGKLNPQMVEDIMTFMTTHFGMKARDVKYAITSKCADESKSLRQRLRLGN